MNNNTLPNYSSFVGCSINWKIVYATWLNTVLVSCIAAFAGNVLLIVVIHRTVELRTTTNLFVANMTISNVFLPAVNGLNNILINRKGPTNLSHTTGAVLCKFFGFFINVSYGVSMLSLVVITVYRFLCSNVSHESQSAQYKDMYCTYIPNLSLTSYYVQSKPFFVSL